jgi:hypothetical protein
MQLLSFAICLSSNPTSLKSFPFFVISCFSLQIYLTLNAAAFLYQFTTTRMQLLSFTLFLSLNTAAFLFLKMQLLPFKFTFPLMQLISHTSVTYSKMQLMPLYLLLL